jgi:magnesium-transporting ATPase (P-type)
MWTFDEFDTGRKSLLHRLKSKIFYNVDYSGVTLAIGDGANDIPMLQSAHVGIGITGREGLAASRAADYSISQFRFLQELLLVHGRYNYYRVSQFILGTFYKGIVFYVSQAFFQNWTGYSGTSLYEQWTLAMYNVLFSSFPVLVTGMFDKDLEKSTLLAVPELYQFGQQNKGFNVALFFKWILQALWHMFISIIIPLIAFNGLRATVEVFHPSILHTMFFSDSNGLHQESSMYMIGTFVYTNVIFFTTLRISFFESNRYTIYNFGAAVFSIFIWIAWQFVYTTTKFPTRLGYDAHGNWYALVETYPLLLTVCVLTISTGVLFSDFLQLSVRWIWNGGIRYGKNTDLFVDPRIGDMSKYHGQDRFKSQKKCAEDVVNYLYKSGILVSNWNDAVEWWQQWESIHGIGST